MTDLASGLAYGVAGWLLTYLFHSSVLLLGALVVTRLVRLGPRCAEFVWKTAILGGVVTSTALAIAAPEGAEVYVVALRTTVDEAEVSGVRAGGPGEAVEVRPRGVLLDDDGAAWPWRADERRSSFPTTALRWALVVLTLVWGVGASIGAVSWWRRRVAVRDVSDRLSPAGSRASSIFAGVSNAAVALYPSVAPRGTTARLTSSDEIPSPCVVPGGTIVLPGRCESDLDDCELRAVLAHELAHVLRADVAWSGWVRLFGAIWWIQPLNRIAVARLDSCAEYACDDWALSVTGERYGLASAISRVAGWEASGRPLATVAMARPSGALTGRVRRILRPSPGRDARWLALAISGLLLASTYWLPSLPGPRTEISASFVVDSVSTTASGTADGTVELVLHRTVVAASTTTSRWLPPREVSRLPPDLPPDPRR